jgi:hypothetical protein
MSNGLPLHEWGRCRFGRDDLTVTQDHPVLLRASVARFGIGHLAQSVEEPLCSVSADAGRIDAFGRTVDCIRVSVTDRCNLRCT